MPLIWLNTMDTVNPTSVHAEAAVRFASETLYALTGEKFTGIQTSTESFSADNLTSMEVTAAVYQGSIRNIPVQQGYRNLRLRHSPIRNVLSITFDGKVMPPSTYAIANGSYLVRRDRTPWVLDSMGSLTVTYVHGTKIPAAGKIAATRLANEYIYLKTDDEQCTLPSRISTSISRQGETISVLDPLSFLNEGKTGVYEVDLFIAAANPTGAKKKAKVFSVDRPRGERLT